MKRIERISISYGSFVSGSVDFLLLIWNRRQVIKKRIWYVIFRQKLILQKEVPLKIADVKNDLIGINR
jgi:hypothetical protein